jgi:hypothetical protein
LELSGKKKRERVRPAPSGKKLSETSFAGAWVRAALFQQESSHDARKVARPAPSGKKRERVRRSFTSANSREFGGTPPGSPGRLSLDMLDAVMRYVGPHHATDFTTGHGAARRW